MTGVKAGAASAEQVRRTFDRYATEFDRWFTQNGKLYASELEVLKATAPRGLSLDVWVGSGAFASKLGVSVGVDTCRELLKISRKRRLEVILADARELPFRAGAFDTVMSSFTICFVDDTESMLAESRRVVKESGRFVLGEITLDSRWGKTYSREGRKGHRFYGKARFMTFRRTLALLRGTGFEVKRVLGTISFAPSDEPLVEDPVELPVRWVKDIGRYGFLGIVATPADT